MFAYLAKQGEQGAGDVKSFVAVSVPMAVFHPLSDPFKFLMKSKAALEVGSMIMGSSSPATMGSIFGDLGTPMDKLFYNGKNMEDGTIRALFHQAQEEMSPGQFKQLLGMVGTERFTSLDGQVDYTGSLDRVTTPTCFLVGTVDNMATAGAVQYAYRQVSSADKQFRLFGRVNGQQNDYGHDDIIVGEHAEREVYPVIRQWLNKYRKSTEETDLMLQPAKGQ